MRPQKRRLPAGQFGVQGASANLQQAQANLQKTTITAPAAGVIAALNVKEGERVVGTAQMAGTENAYHRQPGSDGSACPM